MRIKFEKGKQRKFVDRIILETGCPSLKELINRGIDVNYQTLKNYYSERRLLPLELFEELCRISGIDKRELGFEMVEDNFGQIRGGKKSKR